MCGRTVKSSPQNNPQVTATQKTIATDLGISVATVSRALRNDPRISTEMKERVHKAAAELGYKPNPLVSALMERVRSGRKLEFRGTIAVITDQVDSDGWRKNRPTHRLIYEGAKRRAEEFGYLLEEFSILDFAPEGRRLSQVLVNRGIQGIYITPGIGQQKIALEWEHFSPVTSGYSLIEPVVCRVCFAIFEACRIACDELMARGYRRIGFHLHTSHDLSTDHRYRASYLLFQDMFPIENRLPINIANERDKGQFFQWLEKEQPDAVVSGNQFVIDWIREAGLKCPDDFGYVDMDWVPEKGDVAGVYHNPELIGAVVVDNIIAQINRNESGIPTHPRRTLIHAKWIDGPTIRPAWNIEASSLALA